MPQNSGTRSTLLPFVRAVPFTTDSELDVTQVKWPSLTRTKVKINFGPNPSRPIFSRLSIIKNLLNVRSCKLQPVMD